jgi:hypothetical protein
VLESVAIGWLAAAPARRERRIGKRGDELGIQLACISPEKKRC